MARKAAVRKRAASFRSIKTTMLRAALKYPETKEAHPWGESVVKVRGKVFVFFGVPGESLHVTVKLPQSCGIALELSFTEPTGYGLGKSGWVTATIPPGDTPPVPMLLQWIDESYRAVAPKKLARALDAGEE